MMVREQRDIKPFVLKLGLALALSFAGFVYSRLRTRRIKPSPSLPSPCSSGHGCEDDLGAERSQHKDGLHSIKKTSSSCNIVSIAGETYEETYIRKMTVENYPVGLSPSSKHNGDKDAFLLPEFTDLVKELDFGATNGGNSSKKDAKTPRSDEVAPRVYVSPEKDDYEREIKHLKNMVRVLQEREKYLEVQLLEYYGLKEQETAVMELQNRLKINHMEARLFTLKIESLQSENQRLEAQVSDHAKVVAELEAAKAKLRLLKKKLRHEAEQNRERILTLQQRVAKLQDQEHKPAANDPNIQLKLQRLKDLENEVEQLRISNLRLQTDNSDLARRLERTQILASYVLEDPEADALKQESERLRQENERLLKETEQLQADRCSDAEELVYMRWVNACLRYELRNYQAPPGKTVARDLSKSLSPRSEKKAKQLILEYANTEGIGERGVSIMDFDSDRWSSSQEASFLTDSGEYDDSSVCNTSATRTNTSSKANIFRKLTRLLRGKDSHHHNQVLSGEKTGSLEDHPSPRSSFSISTGNDTGAECHRNEFAIQTTISRSSCDFNRLSGLKEEDIIKIDCGQGNSDVRSSYEKKDFVRRGNSADFRNRLHLYPDSTEKSNLMKYAEALKDSSSRSTPVRRTKSAHFSSF
ncbi:protein CHUP1, chloroplastic [Quillaja saponaria]|uniref:Protein CHUP1, chloroplastic n=1 Tax=Quillaja saponaria TaxID=32244 RepID=A0AAD7L6T5_QUISA|nr:protein CHUP1, chloroplastic [Quillaja saponaria]